MPSSKIIKRICNDKFFTGHIKFVVALLISIQKYAFESQQELRNISINNFVTAQKNNELAPKAWSSL